MFKNKRVHNMIHGGRVPPQNKYPTKYERQNRDTQPAIAEEGALVIPKEHVRLVESFLKKSGIILPVHRQRTNRPVDVILVVNELVIPPPYVPQVVKFLKSNGINLPNT
jgi:hypothetical protein